MHYILTKEDIYKGNLVLINQKNHLHREVLEQELESFNSHYSNILFNKAAIQKLQAVFQEIGIKDEFVPVSGYRTYQDQLAIFNDSMKESGREFTLKYVAYPDASEHQTGLAIDLGLNQKEIDFICPSFPHDNSLCNKFREVSINYGFIERYKIDKINITNISSEEWHFRYVGYPHSEIMTRKNMCLEEYILYLKEFVYDINPLKYGDYYIAYLKSNGHKVLLESDNNLEISGNNIDGYIITWKCG